MKIQSVVIVLAVTITLGVTFYLHYSADAHAIDRLQAEATRFFAWARAEVDNDDPQKHLVGFTATADAALEVCINCNISNLNKRITAKVVLENGQKVLDTTNAVALLFRFGWIRHGKEAEAAVAHIPNFKAFKIYLGGCNDCGNDCGSSS